MTAMMSHKISWLLWLAILVSAFAVIYTSYHARQRFIDWQGLLTDAREYKVEWGQLLLEKSTMASYSRLEHMAADTLKMTEPSTKQIVVVRGDY